MQGGTSHRRRARLSVDRGTIRPLAYPAVQNIERDGTRVQDMIVELPYVEAVSELFVRESAQLLQLELADLVCQRLTGPDQISVNLNSAKEQDRASIGTA